jgi:hypothetical protein
MWAYETVRVPAGQVPYLRDVVAFDLTMQQVLIEGEPWTPPPVRSRAGAERPTGGVAQRPSVPAGRREAHAERGSAGAERRRTSRELLQEAEIVLVEETNVVDLMTEQQLAFHTHAPGDTGHLLGIVAAVA